MTVRPMYRSERPLDSVTRSAKTPGGLEPFEAEARVSLFGFEPTTAILDLRPRAKSWRVRGVVRILVVTLIVAPSVVVIPPHAPWVLGALAAGIILARRRWKEHFTLEAVHGTCPRCGGDLSGSRGRLRSPHPLSCAGCRHEVSVQVPAETLAAHEA